MYPRRILIEKEYFDELTGDKSIRIEAEIAPLQFETFLKEMNFTSEHKQSDGQYLIQLSNEHTLRAKYENNTLYFNESIR